MLIVNARNKQFVCIRYDQIVKHSFIFQIHASRIEFVSYLEPTRVMRKKYTVINMQASIIIYNLCNLCPRWG